MNQRRTHFSTSKVREFFSPFDKIIGVSKDCAQKFIEKYGFENKVTYIYNPIDIEDIEIKKKKRWNHTMKDLIFLQSEDLCHRRHLFG